MMMMEWLMIPILLLVVNDSQQCFSCSLHFYLSYWTTTLMPQFSHSFLVSHSSQQGSQEVIAKYSKEEYDNETMGHAFLNNSFLLRSGALTKNIQCVSTVPNLGFLNGTKNSTLPSRQLIKNGKENSSVKWTIQHSPTAVVSSTQSGEHHSWGYSRLLRHVPLSARDKSYASNYDNVDKV